jgi:hypothetical protein
MEQSLACVQILELLFSHFTLLPIYKTDHVLPIEDWLRCNVAQIGFNV